MKHYITILLMLLILGCNKKENIDYVDPMIGTNGIGHTFPGATTPFGMVQLSPSNEFKNWNWCSGYHYSDQIIKGFAHTHFSGAGLAGLGDILVMPTMGDPTTNSGTEEAPETGYRSRFSHDKEDAKAGYYSVTLLDDNIDVELTASPRVGFHKYTFHNSGEANVVFDPTHHLMETIFGTSVEIIGDNAIRGYKKANGEAGKRTVYFYAEFSKPFNQYLITNEDQPKKGISKFEEERAKAVVTFDVKSDEQLELKVAISNVSFEGAKKNFDAEAKTTSFDQALVAAQNAWREKLNKIEIETIDEDDKVVFMTGMYHSFISPNLLSDVDGNFVVEGKKYHTDYPQYSNYSTWDTFRALHPLFTIIEKEKTAEFVNSLVSRKTVSDVELPIWEAVGHDNICMIGYNTVSPIADAILKDIPGINQQEAYQTMLSASNYLGKHSPNYDVNGMDDYLKFYYVPGEIGSSVSKTTEQNYYDWTIAQVAHKLGDSKNEQLYLDRSKGYRALFDKKSGYLLPKMSDGTVPNVSTDTWDDLVKNYVSGNIWAYSMYVPHDVKAYMQMFGGPKKFAQKIDSILADTTTLGGAQHVDISGFIGKYGHGDEPGHQIPYFYVFAQEPWKTQELVHQVMDEFYHNDPDGLVNNEDLGQMSAWYIFSAMGFYPVTPGDMNYIIGSPKVKAAKIKLENGKTFSVKVNNASDKNVYIQSVSLNGKQLDRAYIQHHEIMDGGELVFEMQATPNKTWATSNEATPGEKITSVPEVAQRVTNTPYSSNAENFFGASLPIKLFCNNTDAIIRYTLDGSEPNAKSKKYTNGIQIYKSTTLKAKAFKEGLIESKTFEHQYIKTQSARLGKGYPKINLSHETEDYGKTDGSQLIDQKLASDAFADGHWNGFIKNNLEAVIDLGKTTNIKQVKYNTLSNTYVWIFPPKATTVWVSTNKKNWKKVGYAKYENVLEHEHKIITNSVNIGHQNARYIKIEIENYGGMPKWHGGAGQTPFLMIDEIYLNE
ncbi:GH92 family glycosyl hydrolase [Flammeovirga pacifica]|uniref:Glycosyl hydrolase family 92 n=1 Tax=Flammeovirga pacifica TaxID=915059 RepID=A0A1S1YTD1_FLAPC|nr:GH92 family glycosyl hydrolase [Flammeovirga pacifica]OHX64291.1 hypothetical protein NH26_22080 [Flammeovirga pacifica]